MIMTPTDHLSPPSTMSRLSDSDTTSDVDFDGMNTGRDGASISSLGSSSSPPPEVRSKFLLRFFVVIFFISSPLYSSFFQFYILSFAQNFISFWIINGIFDPKQSKIIKLWDSNCYPVLRFYFSSIHCLGWWLHFSLFFFCRMCISDQKLYQTNFFETSKCPQFLAIYDIIV